MTSISNTSIEDTIQKYVQQQKKLLELELQAEEQEQSSYYFNNNNNNNNSSNKSTTKLSNVINNDDDTTSARILRNLQVDQISLGLLGKTVVTFTTHTSSSSSSCGDDQNPSTSNDHNNNKTIMNNKKKSKGGRAVLPSHRLTIGDEVEIFYKNTNENNTSSNSRNPSGVISSLSENSISIQLFNTQKSQHPTTNTTTTTNTTKDDLPTTLELGSYPYTIIPKSSIAVHKKLLQALDELQNYSSSSGNNSYPIIADKFIQYYFSQYSLLQNLNPGNTTSMTASSSLLSTSYQNSNWTPVKSNLDDSQLDAISFCLWGNQPVSLIHGPPGTGKTTTIAELIYQAIHIHKWKILVTAPSNVAVDNLLERLIEYNDTIKSSSANCKNNSSGTATNTKMKLIRLGHPTRISSNLLHYSLEYLVQSSPSTDVIQDAREELNSYLQILSQNTSTMNSNSNSTANRKKVGTTSSKRSIKNVDKRLAYREMKMLRKEIKQREEKVIDELLDNANVILATNVGCSNSVLEKYLKRIPIRNGTNCNVGFDLVVIDEAAQALEASCWIPIMKGKRVVLGGDHCQLPPTVKSTNYEVQKELNKTLFERIMEFSFKSNHKEHDDNFDVSRMLKVQYRMHEDISDWASLAMYGGLLRSHESVKARKLYHLPSVSVEHDWSMDDPSLSLLPLTRDATLLLIDTAGCEMFESTNSAGSRYNDGEAEVVCQHVRNLVTIGLRPEDIAVISPYNGQVELLRNKLLDEYPKLEIRSVDGFQGGEREAVVLSLVRSSERGGKDGIGFLRDERRLNVAVTRAKRQCTLICDSETVSQNKFLSDLVLWMEEKGEYLSALELTSNQEITGLSSDLTDKIMKTVTTVNPPEKETLVEDKESLKLKCNFKDETKKRLSFFSEISEVGEYMELVVTSMDDCLVVRELCDDFDLVYANESRNDTNEIVISILKSNDTEVKKSGFNHRPDINSSFGDVSQPGDEIELVESLISSAVIEDYCTNVGIPAASVVEDCSESMLIPKSGDIHSIQSKVERPGDTFTTDVESGGSSSVKIASNATETASTSLNECSTDNEEAVEIKSSESRNDDCNMNSLLGSLAKERAARSSKTVAQMKKPKPKNTSKKVGGSKASVKSGGVKDESFNIEDDMAFLDAQIEKVQTSHGRKIDAKGSNYRTIINGVLLSKPKEDVKKMDSIASHILKDKLKQAQNSRKAKPKKK